MNNQLNFESIIDMMIRRWWIIAIATIAMSIAAFTYTEVFVDPIYSSDGFLYVNAQKTQSSDISTGSLSASQQLVSTYKEILSRRTFLSQVTADLDEKYTINDLKKMVTLQPVNDTEILQVSVIGKVPEDTSLICHSILVHATTELKRVVNAGSVKILDDSQIPQAPISPSVKKNTLVGFLLGFIIGSLIVLLLELFDTRIKSSADIVERYDEPLLGEIPVLFSSKR